MACTIFSAEMKAAILREYFEKQISVADICEKHRVHSNRFYQWKKDLFENTAELFFRKRGRNKQKTGVKMGACPTAIAGALAKIIRDMQSLSMTDLWNQKAND